MTFPFLYEWVYTKETTTYPQMTFSFPLDEPSEERMLSTVKPGTTQPCHLNRCDLCANGELGGGKAARAGSRTRAPRTLGVEPVQKTQR